MTDETDDEAVAESEQARLLSELRVLRRDTRARRHGYWFPLILLGVLACASLPLYLPPGPLRSGPGGVTYARPRALPLTFFGGWPFQTQGGLAYYWLASLPLALLVTFLWYRRYGRQTGLQTSVRGYVITGALLIAAVLAASLVTTMSSHPAFLDPIVFDASHGAFPLTIMAAGLWVLAWAERSWGLTVTVALFTAAAVLANLYDVGNLAWYAFSWNVGSSYTAIPGIVLSALVLLVSGTVVAIGQRRRRVAS